jgi:hypothetical protein
MLKTPQKCDSFAALFGRPSNLGLSLNLHFDQKNAFLGPRRTGDPMFVRRSFLLSSPHAHDGLPPTRRRRAGCASAFFKRGPIKVGNTQRTSLRRHLSVPAGALCSGGWTGHPARCASSGMYGEALPASPAGSAPARCRFHGTYGGQGKAAGSSDLPAALLCVRGGRPAGRATLAPNAARPSNKDTLWACASLDDWASRQ